MLYHFLLCFVHLVLDVLAAAGVATSEKDLEIALLRQQIRVLEHKVSVKVRLSRPEKLMLVALADRFKGNAQRAQDWLRQYVLLVKPDTLLEWHRELVRRKWTFKPAKVGGRPPLDADLEALILRLARENPRLGYDKIQGEMLKLGYHVASSTVRNVLHRHQLLPAPQRGHSSWRTFLQHYRQQMLACDFFSVETIGLQTLYVLFFIELGSRRVYLAGCTAQPDSAWVSQQARQVVDQMSDRSQPMRFLIHDRGTKFTADFDEVFTAEGIKIVLTPYRTPQANAYAERWVRTVREECLDHLLILNSGHLRRVLAEYLDYYHCARPHQGLAQEVPMPCQRPREGTIRRRDVLGGVLHDYYREAA